MKKDFGSKSWLYPMPVLIVAAYDEQGVPNVMNAAWDGMFTDETIGICLSAGHKTTKKYPCNTCLHRQHGHGRSSGCLRLCGYRLRE